jgi:lipopolysaccharide transport system ATP-binding protein
MYVRLAFAVAAHLEPEILVVDEVLAVGDAEFQKKCIGRMGQVSREGRTVLFVSHNMTAVRSLCNRVILFRNGQSVADAGTDDVLHVYQSEDFKEALHRTWEPPQPHEPGFKTGLYLQEAKILLDGDDEVIRVTSAFSLAFCIHAKREALIGLSPHYLGIGGEVIFAAPSPSKRLQIGENWFICNMPSSFLNDGVYSVQLMIVEESVAIQVVNEALVFEVHDLVRDGAWHGKWPGVVRPSLEWKIQRQI